MTIQALNLSNCPSDINAEILSYADNKTLGACCQVNHHMDFSYGAVSKRNDAVDDMPGQSRFPEKAGEMECFVLSKHDDVLLKTGCD